ncbi:MAG: phosphoglucosamine mutase, partial [Candidatus Eiseniibacteriota bacterium]
IPQLLKSLGAEVDELDCAPNGAFTRELEPLPENLGALSQRVRERGADFGVALDPDADRAAFVDQQGVPLGEEYTVALGTSVVLEKHAGPVVTNLSTSRILDAVCARFGAPLYRTAVGEAHVVAALRSRGAVAGGEGNGGMILPAAHYGRDGLVAVALVANLLATHGGTLRDAANRLPRLHMIKARWKRQGGDWNASAKRLREAFADMMLDETDGLHFSRGDAWVHVRTSGTEPVVRAIAESPDEQLTRSLVERAGRALGEGV